MNGFEIYKVYLAIKLHFTSKNRSYDFHRHGGRTTAKLGKPSLKEGIDIFFTNLV